MQETTPPKPPYPDLIRELLTDVARHVGTLASLPERQVRRDLGLDQSRPEPTADRWHTDW